MAIEDYVNDLVEPNFMYDDIALMIVSMVTKQHILVILNNNYWTSHSNFTYENCRIKLAYMGNGEFKEMIPRPPQVPPPKTQIALDAIDYEDDAGLQVTPQCTLCKQKIPARNPRRPHKRPSASSGPVTHSKVMKMEPFPDPEMRADLQGTGMLPDFLNNYIPEGCEDPPEPVFIENKQYNSDILDEETKTNDKQSVIEITIDVQQGDAGEINEDKKEMETAQCDEIEVKMMC